jgi:putative peptide zinc metalloprotease protein
VLSKVYMALMSVMIVWGLAKVLAPYHLQNLAYAAGLTILASALVNPISGAIQIARNPIKRADVRTGRVSLLTALGLAAVVGIMMIPIDYEVRAPLVLMPDDAARVYATVGGTIEKILPAGTKVNRGDVIGRLQSTEIELELARLEGELKLRQLHVEHLEKLRGVDREANDQLPTARSALADSQRRLAERQSEAKRLTLVAPADGVIIPAPRREEDKTVGGAHATRLPTWSGSLVERNMTGAHVEPGTMVCLVGDPQRLTAVLLVDDSDVKRVAPGQKTRMRIDELPGEVIEGEVVEISRHELDATDRSENAREDLKPLLAGLVAPGREGALYEVRVKLSQESGVKGQEPERGGATRALIIGGRGDAKVTAERITVGRRIYRYLAQTFRLSM